jgi:hypothetical protein
VGIGGGGELLGMEEKEMEDDSCYFWLLTISVTGWLFIQVFSWVLSIN